MSVEGLAAPGFERVAEEFERNFTDRGEVGGAFCAVENGRVLVDIWGGSADTAEQRPWQEDTMQMIFSGTKALVAVCLLILIDRARLRLDETVAHYWPEFGARGKEDVLVRDLVSHSARLPGLERPVTRDQILDGRAMARLLASQAPNADPRAVDVYHSLTYGWLCAELVHRIEGRSIGEFFSEEVATPLGLELYIGLPTKMEPQVATLELADTWGTHPAHTDTFVERDPLAWSVRGNPPLFLKNSFPWNEPDFHNAEIPAVNAIGTARSVARMFARLDALVSVETIKIGTTELSKRRDPLLDEVHSFGLGFMLQTGDHRLGPPPGGFGHLGIGGSVHGAWPNNRIGFSYATNMLRDDEGADTRAGALLRALYRGITEKPE